MNWLQEKIAWLKAVGLWPQEMSEWLVNLFSRNVLIKFFALLFSVSLWLYVMNETNPLIFQSVDREIALRNAPAGYAVARSEEFVRMRFRVQRSNFASAQGRVQAFVDLANAEEGTHRYAVETVRPPGFDLLEISPREIQVTLDKVVEREEKVVIVRTGQPDNGAILTDLKPSVEKVKVKGPRSVLKRVVRVTGFVALGGHEEDFSVNTALLAIGDDNRVVDGVDISPEEIPVSVRIVSANDKKTVTVAPLLTGQLAPGYTLAAIKVNPARVEIAGKPARIEKIQAVDTQPIDLAKINPANLTDGKYKLIVGLQAADGQMISLQSADGLSASHQTVEVEILIEPKPTKP